MLSWPFRAWTQVFSAEPFVKTGLEQAGWCPKQLIYISIVFLFGSLCFFCMFFDIFQYWLQIKFSFCIFYQCFKTRWRTGHMCQDRCEGVEGTDGGDGWNRFDGGCTYIFINLYCMSILCMDRSWGVDFAFVVSESKQAGWGNPLEQMNENRMSFQPNSVAKHWWLFFRGFGSSSRMRFITKMSTSQQKTKLTWCFAWPQDTSGFHSQMMWGVASQTIPWRDRGFAISIMRKGCKMP